MPTLRLVVCGKVTKLTDAAIAVKKFKAWELYTFDEASAQAWLACLRHAMPDPTENLTIMSMIAGQISSWRFCPFTRDFPELEELCLAANNLYVGFMHPELPLSRMSRLTRLDVSFNGHNPNPECQNIWKQLPGVITLTELNLTMTTVDYAKVRVGQLTNLTMLKINSNDTKADDIVSLLSQLLKLQHFECKSNELKEQGLMEVLKQLSELPRISYVDVSDNLQNGEDPYSVDAAVAATVGCFQTKVDCTVVSNQGSGPTLRRVHSKVGSPI
jgi:hypothetical protein